MTTYLLPCYEDIPSDWEDLITILNTQADIVIGDIYDIEEF